MVNSPLEFLARQYGNVVRYDAEGVPSIFVKFPKMKSKDLHPSLPDHTHPAFIINGQEQDSILIGKYMASEIAADERLYSLPNMPPRVSLGADEFLARMRDFGGGVSGKTAADSGFLLLLALKNGWNPSGNTNYGAHYADADGYMLGQEVKAGDLKGFRGWLYECLIAHTTSAELVPAAAPRYWKRIKLVGGTPSDPAQYNADNHCQGYNTLTGTGPLSWYLDGTPGSLCDIVGNAYEQDYGYRIVRGEIQIMENNNAAHPDADLSANSAAWKAILPNKDNYGYTLVAPGTAGTLHWTWQNNKITLDTMEPVFDNEKRLTKFKDLTANTAHVPYVPFIMRELGLFPVSGDRSQGYVYISFTEAETLLRRGGCFSTGQGAGLGCLGSTSIRPAVSEIYSARPRSLE